MVMGVAKASPFQALVSLLVLTQVGAYKSLRDNDANAYAGASEAKQLAERRLANAESDTNALRASNAEKDKQIAALVLQLHQQPLKIQVDSGLSAARRTSELSRLNEQVAVAAQRQREAEAERARQAETQSRLQGKLLDLATEGDQLRIQWQQNVGSAAEIQQRSANAIGLWHTKVEAFLLTMPRGQAYRARFRIERQMLGVPSGMQVALSGYWALILTDVAHLNEFIADPDLGKESTP